MRFERNAANNAVARNGSMRAGFDNGFDVDAVGGCRRPYSWMMNVLRHVPNAA